VPVNDTRDFYIGKRLPNLPRLRQVGFQADRRLLRVEKISHDCMLAKEAFQQLNRPRQVDGQRVSALRFGDPQVHKVLGFKISRTVPGVEGQRWTKSAGW
jgi:hypothetical protein